MPHTGFGGTLNPDPFKKFDPPPNFFRHSTTFMGQVRALQQSCITLYGYFFVQNVQMFAKSEKLINNVEPP